MRGAMRAHPLAVCPAYGAEPVVGGTEYLMLHWVDAQLRMFALVHVWTHVLAMARSDVAVRASRSAGAVAAAVGADIPAAASSPAAIVV